MQLVTGYTGVKHVSAQDDSIRNVMLGEFNGRGVFPILEEFEAVAVTANEVRVRSGYGINQGRLFKIDRNDYDSCTIENGAAGLKRVDLIVARYLKNEQTGIESCELVVIKGTPNANAYVDPSYTKGTLIDGALQDDMPMYRVKINGVAIEAVEPMFKVYRSLIGGAEDLIDQMVDDNFDDKMAANQARFDQMINSDHNAYTSQKNSDHTAYTNQKNSDHQAYQTMMNENDSAFDEWFAQVQAYLDEETATKLANAIASHNTALKQMTGYGTDAAGNVNSLGVLPANKGGTGQTSLQATRNAMGLGNTTGALPVANGGTGKSSIGSGKVLVGNGTSTPTERAIDTTSGGTAGSTSLITSGAANAGYVKRDLLWTNPSPGNDWNSAIKLPTLYDYDYIEIEYMTSKMSSPERGWHFRYIKMDTNQKTVPSPSAFPSRLIDFDVIDDYGISLSSRDLYYKTVKDIPYLYTGPCYNAIIRTNSTVSISLANSELIPYRVYGMKNN